MSVVLLRRIGFLRLPPRGQIRPARLADAAAPARCGLEDAQGPRGVHVRRPDSPFPGYEAAHDYATRSGDSFIGPGFYKGEVKHRTRVLGQVSPPVLCLWGTGPSLAARLHILGR